jgi:solute carrier family 35 protein C2
MKIFMRHKPDLLLGAFPRPLWKSAGLEPACTFSRRRSTTARVSVQRLGPLSGRIRRTVEAGGHGSLGHFLLQVAFHLMVWFTSSIFIAFANKRLLSHLDFHFPFFLTFATNAGVASTSWCVTRFERFAQPPVPSRTYWRVIVPMGLATTLDVGFSNWSLIMLSVSFHVIIKGTSPLFVMLCGMMLGVERCSRRMPLTVVLIVSGLSLVACDRLTLPERPLGILLGIISVTFTGLRWALTQLLVRGSLRSERELAHNDARRGDEHVHPLASMLHTMPIIAAGSMALVLVSDERAVFARLAHDASGDGAPLGWLLLYLGLLVTLVFAVVLAEFNLVRLTSSLTLSIVGVVKELVTVMVAVAAGDRLSAVNVCGLVLCVLGNVAYFLKRTKEREVHAEPETRPVLNRSSEEPMAAADEADSYR